MTIPGDLSEQAEVDGCTPVQALYQSDLCLCRRPLWSRPGLLIFIGAWNEFLFAVYLHVDLKPCRLSRWLFSYFGGEPRGALGRDLGRRGNSVAADYRAGPDLPERSIVQGLTAGSLQRADRPTERLDLP